MSWTRGLLAALAVCVLLLTGSAGCGSSDGREQGENGASPSPVGKVLDDTDGEGRHYREVDEEGAPEVGIEVEPDGDGSWDVRLTVRNFTFSPAGTERRAVPGRGVAHLFVDDRPVAALRTPRYRLAGGYLPHGTHHVTARLYADDGTVWAVDGEPVESTADITASDPRPTARASPTEDASPGTEDGSLRTGGRGSTGDGGKAS